MIFFKKKKLNQYAVHVLPQNITFQGSPEESLLSEMLQNNISISHSCEGMGSCGTCRVKVIEGSVDFDAKSFSEIMDRELAEDEILCCQARLLSDIRVIIE